MATHRDELRTPWAREWKVNIPLPSEFVLDVSASCVYAARATCFGNEDRPVQWAYHLLFGGGIAIDDHEFSQHCEYFRCASAVNLYSFLAF
jgi:hypothetical protein